MHYSGLLLLQKRQRRHLSSIRIHLNKLIVSLRSHLGHALKLPLAVVVFQRGPITPRINASTRRNRLMRHVGVGVNFLLWGRVVLLIIAFFEDARETVEELHVSRGTLPNRVAAHFEVLVTRNGT